jgi:exonuclease III
VIAIIVVRGCRHREPPIRFATFNIENFPQHERQIAGAFAEIARLDVGFVAVQEITEPAIFQRAARERLGERWEFVAAPDGWLGVLFDRARWSFLSMTVHDETRLDDRHKPVLEVRLGAGDVVVRVLVVHFKAGGDGRDVRARQYAALGGIVRRALASGERVVVLGDFNATDDRADRGDLAALAANGLVWATEPLACSAFWDRDDGCFRSRLDHVLAWAAPTSVTAAGACASDGCEREDSCPRYTRDVSDHCPVVIDIKP